MGVEYMAATAFCGVMYDPWDHSTGVRERFHEFWSWWLHEAVPTAYHAAPAVDGGSGAVTP
jgi:hypothetical protein